MEQEFQVFAEAGGNGDGAVRGTTAIDRGAELLVRVLQAEQPVALTDLASASGIPKSTASRLLSALERQGLVAQDGARGRLRPGPAILRVAERGLYERSLVQVSQPTLEALGELSGETINLGVPGAEGVEHVAQVDSRHFLGAGQWVGRTADYHCTAVGKVLMACGRVPVPDGPLPRFTEHTICDPRRLDEELARVRREGFAAAIDELEPGLAAIAAPVRGGGARVVAALSISGPTIRMSPERIAELRPVLISEAGALSHRLGNRQGDEVR